MSRKGLWLGLAGFFLVLAAIFYLRDNPLHLAPPPVASVQPTGATPIVPAPAPPSPVGATAPLRQTVANLEYFQVVRSDPAADQYDFQLDAREQWRALPGITVSAGDQIEFWASGLVCGGEKVGCAGPNGQNGLARTSLTNPDEFPFGNGYCQALLARVGPHMFQVGDQKTYIVPDGTGNESIELMDNFRLPYVAYATGGFRVKLLIRRRTP